VLAPVPHSHVVGAAVNALALPFILRARRENVAAIIVDPESV
jgi:hypothetical protein